MRWDADSFFQAIATREGERTASVARRFYEWAVAKGLQIKWGTGEIDGSFSLYFTHNQQVYALFSVKTYGMIELNFQYYQKYEPFDCEINRMNLLREVNEVITRSIPMSKITKLPKVPLKDFLLERDRLAFVSIFERMINSIIQHGEKQGGVTR